MDCISQAWPGWEAGDLIGEGAFGRVYSASNAEGGVTTRAAVKVINIPRDEAEAASLRSMGYDAEAIRAYFEDEARSLLGEIASWSDLMVP